MKKSILIIVLILTPLLGACTRQKGWVGMNYGNMIDVSYQFFDGKTDEKVQVDAGDSFYLTYDIKVDNGELHLELIDPDRELVWEASFLEDNQDEMRFRAVKSGRYLLRMIGHQTKGGFELRWETRE